MLTSQIYSLIVSGATDLCYANCLAYFAKGSKVLDVGIGNGQMLDRWHPIIKHKQLRLVGIDQHREYLFACRNRVTRYGLDDHVSLIEGSVLAFEPDAQGTFEYILFSMSFMLLDDPWNALAKAKTWLGAAGEIIFVQTVFNRRSRALEFLKPRLKYLTSIDFGRVIYYDAFVGELEARGLVVKSSRVLTTTHFGGEFRMVVVGLA